MLQKVKKLGSKLFGDGPEYEEPRSPGAVSPKPKTPGARKSDMMDVDPPSPSSRVAGGSIGAVHSPNTKLPPVHHSGNSGSSQGSGYVPQPPPAIAGVLAQAGNTGSGRRKSTPAALDMALRTAEGKAAIEELITSAGKKQMVFGQYFPTGPKPGSSAAAADKAGSRMAKPSPPALPSQGKPMLAVPEDEPEHPVKQVVAKPAAAPSSVGSPSSSASKNVIAGSSSAAAGTSSSSPQTMDVTPSGSSRLVGTPQKRPAESPTSQPAAQKPAVHVPTPVHEEAPPPGKQTKILSVATQLPTGMARKYWLLSDYSILRKMYTGYASTVYQATCKKSLEQVALKVYHMENLCELNHYQVYREIRVHAGLSHQNIIQLYCAFQEGHDVVMVQEYAEGGDLYRLLHRNGGRLTERQAVEMVLHPFLLSLHYLHTRGIMHRDIKPENVLFTDQRVLKLADFGLAIDLTEERAVTRAGTLDYMAPEVLRCPPKNLPQENKNNANLHYNNSVDAWAVGVFAFELIVGVPPFAGESQLASVDKIIHATPEFPEKMSELAKSFITAALKKHPGDRPTVMEMLHHPWIRTYQRRTSVRIPQMMRRRSSVSYQPGLSGQPEEGGLSGAPANIDNMTPEEIERMIQRLQMAKHQADHGL